MKCIKWESENGLKITFVQTYDAQYIFDNISSNIGGEAQTVKSPGQDGISTYGITRSHTIIRLKTHIQVNGNYTKWVAQSAIETRDYIDKCFDPKYFGMLTYYAYSGDKGRRIRCRPTATPTKSEDMNNSYFNANIEFSSDESMWELPDPLVVAMGMVYKNFRFPYYILPTPFAFVYSNTTIFNDTIYNIPPKIYVQNNTMNVEIKNESTGMILKINQGVPKDCRMIIDVKNTKAILEKYNSVNGRYEFAENILNRLSIDSDIEDFYVVPGENQFTIKQYEGQPKPIMRLEAYIPALGV